jgi:hypothetical protein
MSELSQNEQRKLAYFHTLGKVMTENTQELYETKYKSSHNIRYNEIWIDDITYAPDYLTAYAESLSNSAVTVFENVILDMIYGSNGQTYCYVKNGTFKDDTYPISERGQVTSGGTFIRPLISPFDVPNLITNEPSLGYSLILYRGDDATDGNPGDQIFLTDGSWVVDYYSGIIHFAQGYTPIDLGWGSIKATFFQYTGKFGDSKNIGGFQSAIYDSSQEKLIFDQNKPTETSVSLSTLKQKISNSNINMPANITNSANTLACNTQISSNITGGIRVFVNGIEVYIGVDCYFSSDISGNNIKNIGDETTGDYLQWKHVNGLPSSGYELNTKDTISFMYLN